MKAYLICFVLLFWKSTKASVRVSEGLLEGEVVENKYGKSYYSFKGIPYAEPPLGDLRFKAPQPPKPWLGTRNATKFGPICYQIDFFKKNAPSGSEDCLYLNVYTPNIKPDKPLPVMFWIPGGAFYWGSGNDDFYGPDFLVRQDVILVTINYRLEVLGFLCLDTEDAPGNAGMKDQVAALRWVNKNIVNFGGDPNNITIFGQSAGAGSVGYHLISPMTKGLFKRAILQSGSSACWWSLTPDPRKNAIEFAKKRGAILISDDDKKLYEFYKSQPVQSLILTNIRTNLSELKAPDAGVKFAIVSEKEFSDNERFFYGNVEEALRNNIHDGIEVMAGYVEDEFLGIIGILGINFLPLYIKDANLRPEFFVPKKISANCPENVQLDVAKKMKKYYLKGEPASLDNIDQILKYRSIDEFVYGTVETVKFSAQKHKSYLYKFTCKSKRNLFSKRLYHLEIFFGDRTFVCHCDDLPYLFQPNYFNQQLEINSGINKLPNLLQPNQELEIDSKEFKLIEQVTQLWTNFAKFGNPTPDGDLGVQWTEYSEEDKHYLDIGQELTAGTAPDGEELQFWDNIFTEYFSQNNSQCTRPPRLAI